MKLCYERGESEGENEKLRELQLAREWASLGELVSRWIDRVWLGGVILYKWQKKMKDIFKVVWATDREFNSSYFFKLSGQRST